MKRVLIGALVALSLAGLLSPGAMAFPVVNPSSLPQAKMSVDETVNFCSMYFAAGQGAILKIPGHYGSVQVGADQSGSTTDQQNFANYCQQHGVNMGTTTYVPNTPQVTVSSTPAGACSVQLTSQDTAPCLQTDGTYDQSCMANACTYAGQNIQACAYSVTQLEPDCMALLAIRGDKGDSCGGRKTSSLNSGDSLQASGNGSVSGTGGACGAYTLDAVLLAVDAVVASACTVACVNPEAAPIFETACTGGALGASAAEMVASITMQSDSVVGRYISGIMSAAGEATGLANAAAGGLSAPHSMSHSLDQMATSRTNDTAEKAGEQRAACASMVEFDIMAGMRALNLATMQDAAKSETDAINSLISQSSPNGSAGGSAGGGGAGSVSPSLQGSGLFAGGSGSGSSPVGGGGQAAYNSIAQCTQAGGDFGTCAQSAGMITAPATDAGVLTGSNIGPLMKPLDLNSLLDQIKGQGIGPAMAGMASGMGASSDAANALGQLAKAASENPKELASLNMGTGAAMAAGGGGAGGGGAKSDNPFANLFGGGSGGGLFGGKTTTAFNRSPASNDIWHSHTSDNLFQIVSGKIASVANRVR